MAIQHCHCIHLHCNYYDLSNKFHLVKHYHMCYNLPKQNFHESWSKNIYTYIIWLILINYIMLHKIPVIYYELKHKFAPSERRGKRYDTYILFKLTFSSNAYKSNV